MSDNSTYDQLIKLLDERGARYRLIDHPPEGRTDIVSPMRGNELRQAAKCMVVMVKQGKKVTKYVLAVVPGDRKVDLNAIKRLKNGTYVSFANPEIAERLAGSVVGTILPLSFTSELELIVDPKLFEGTDELFFNAARLDRSMALHVDDYKAISDATLEPISQE
ncbi:YbaK/prolyl-tRNA synthetase associated domain-containing protein [Actinoallomurus sp. NBC_01490]|jgi:Ala-tRNA(Pro) deacylase|uniref:YbaK/EbsC family protein n=1 Tax=Actinoallomurus sp. NBC_01490 TaxID=2903557 RepID=UPI002E343B41|nr:YbaK/EbsC family protein [Actinoallomurus sp. NBC_01490]